MYDSGDYLPALEAAVHAIGYADFRDEQRRRRAEGRRVGIGVASYIEGTGIGPYGGPVSPSSQAARSVSRRAWAHRGRVTTPPKRRSWRTCWQSPRTRSASSPATRASSTGALAPSRAERPSWRGAPVTPPPLPVRDKALEVAARALNVTPRDLEMSGGAVRVIGQPDRSITIGELAQRANPLRGAVRPGTEPGLEATAYFGPGRGSTANGGHAMIVEVDPETADGQLLNASFMDYLLPTAPDVPEVQMHHRETPSPLNPLGVNGVGEAGAISTGAAFAHAVEDALAEHGVEIREIPLSPGRFFELTREGMRARAPTREPASR